MTPFNECALQAQAFLSGHADIRVPLGAFHEHVVYHGRTYLVHPPLAAILMMPFVLLFGVDWAQPIGAGCIFAASLFVAARLVDEWLVAFFGFGTILIWATLNASSWELVSLSGTLALLCALASRRVWLVAMWAAIAVLGRYDLVLALPFFFFLTVKNKKDALAFVVPCAVIGSCLIAFNYARFDSFVDRAIFLFAQQDGWLKHLGGGAPAQLRFAPGNLYTLLFAAPNFIPNFPWIHPVMSGQALIFTSPAFLLALNAKPTKENLLLLGTVIAIMIPSIFWYGNGFEQFGNRLWIQAYPFLLVLTSRGWVPRLGKVLVIASIVLCCLGTYQVQTQGF